jgi:hypothetical protein
MNHRRRIASNSFNSMRDALDTLDEYLQSMPHVHAQVEEHLTAAREAVRILTETTDQALIEHPGPRVEAPNDCSKLTPERKDGPFSDTQG